MLGRERVVGDLGMRLRQPAQQRRFAGVGQPDQARVGDDLQLQRQSAALLAGRAGLVFARRAVGGGGEELVAAPAAAAVAPRSPASPGSTRSRRTWPRSRSRMMVPGGTAMTRSLPFLPWQLADPPRSPLLGTPVLAVDDFGEAVGAGDGADDDAAAVAAVAAVRPAARHVLFAPEAAAAAAAVAAFDEEFHTIDEHDASVVAGHHYSSNAARSGNHRRWYAASRDAYALGDGRFGEVQAAGFVQHLVEEAAGRGGVAGLQRDAAAQRQQVVVLARRHLPARKHPRPVGFLGAAHAQRDVGQRQGRRRQHQCGGQRQRRPSWPSCSARRSAAGASPAPPAIHRSCPASRRGTPATAAPSAQAPPARCRAPLTPERPGRS